MISEFPAPSPAVYINLNNFRLFKLEEKMNRNEQNQTELKIGIYILVFVPLGPKLRNTSLYTDPFSTPLGNIWPFFTSCLKATTSIVDYSSKSVYYYYNGKNYM